MIKRIALLVAVILAISLFAFPIASAQTVPDDFAALLIGDGQLMWQADYARTLPSGASWTDGDRDGYRCFYAFLLMGSRVIGRVTFIRVDAAASYVVVNDKRMNEAVRYYDGSIAPPSAPNELNDCPTVTQSYTAFSGDQRPTVNYTNKRTGAIFETRPYASLTTGNGVGFRLDSVTGKRATVVAYLNSLPVIVIYYDSMAANVLMTADL